MGWGDSGHPSPDQVAAEAKRRAKMEYEERIAQIEANQKRETTKDRMEKRGLVEGDIFPAYLKIDGRLRAVQIQFQVSPVLPGGEFFTRFVQVEGKHPALTPEEVQGLTNFSVAPTG